MIGYEGEEGILSRAMIQTFEHIDLLEQCNWKCRATVSVLELYRDQIRDLLSDTPPSRPHSVRHDEEGNTHISELTVVNVADREAVEKLVKQALKRRTVKSTMLNDTSSRSHFVFTLNMARENFMTGEHIQGTLNLVDLAGSERVKESGVTGDELKEAQFINTSLSALKDVITGLQKKEATNCRGSKLTWLLKNSLAEGSRTTMILHLSPSWEHHGETLASLRFASQVSECELNK